VLPSAVSLRRPPTHPKRLEEEIERRRASAPPRKGGAHARDAAPREAFMAYVDWSMRGPEIVNCNCDFGCPCQFNTLPTHGDCRAMMAVRIDKGHFGNVDLSGLVWCAMFAWPKAIHEGNGEAFIVISDKATQPQRDAILTILSGQETDPGATIFNVFAPTFSKMHDPVTAPIEFDLDIDRRKGRVRIAGVIDTGVNPILNPVTGQEHRVRVVLPNGFEYREAEYASGQTSATGPINLSFSNSHTHVAMLNLSTHGAA
jgi:hypothetical protein